MGDGLHVHGLMQTDRFCLVGSATREHFWSAFLHQSMKSLISKAASLSSGEISIGPIDLTGIESEIHTATSKLWKRKSTHSYVAHAFIRCSGGGSGRRGGVQVIQRWYRTPADRRRGADSQPSVCVRRWFYSGASGHPLPKTGHARGAAHGGQSFYMRKRREVVSRCDIVKWFQICECISGVTADGEVYTGSGVSWVNRTDPQRGGGSTSQA